MSDASGRREMEDVLASIRRLVDSGATLSAGVMPVVAAPVEAEPPEGRPVAPEPAARSADGAAFAPRRLLLTPAQRVGQPIAAAPATESNPAPVPASSPALRLTGANEAAAPVPVAAAGQHPSPPQAPRSADFASRRAAAHPAGSEPVADAITAESGAESSLPADEAALRSLIAEVLREELRGAFGERISRNLRRMVRAEIASALATRKLD